MKTQPTPLYAIDHDGQACQVIGWTETTAGKRLPLVVKLGVFGGLVAHPGPLAYLTEPPEFTIPRKARPAEAQTEIIERDPRLSPVNPRNGWAR